MPLALLQVPPLSIQLQKKRTMWQNAYRLKNIDTLAKIETKDFFVLFFQEVVKKEQWHQQVVDEFEDNDPLLKLDAAEKTRHDFPDDYSCMMTSFFKNDFESKLVKEMWVNNNGDWQLGSLAITHIRQVR